MSIGFQRLAGVLLVVATSAAGQTSQTVAALQAKAEGGDAESQFSIGLLYESGQGVPQDYAQAANWYRKAAESGNVLAQDHLAYLYDKGNGVPQDDEEAVIWLRKAAGQGDSWAETSLGTLYSEGQGVPQDDKLAVQWWRKAAAHGDSNARRFLANAVEPLRRQHQIDSTASEPTSQLNLPTGFVLDTGGGQTGTAPAQEIAGLSSRVIAEPIERQETPEYVIRNLLPEAKAGDADAQRRVGMAYENGSAFSQAAYWLRKAAESGDGEAQYRLGHLYNAGNGVPQDANLAALWWRKSAESGYVVAETFVGFMYFTGLDVSQDNSQAAIWWRKAAEQGNPVAQRCLGALYEDGSGVAQDYSLATFWYGKAASQGDTEAQDMLSKLNSRLAIVKADRKRRANQIFFAVLSVAFIIAIMYTVIRLRKKLFGCGKLLLPPSPRSRQLTVVLLVGGWCSGCCLIQVLSKRAMLHPVNAAVTALLWAIPGLIVGSVCMWWLSHPLVDGETIHSNSSDSPDRPPSLR